MAMKKFDEWKNGTKEQDINEMDVLGGLKRMGTFGKSALKGLGSNLAGKISGVLGNKLQSTDAKNLAKEFLGLMGPAVLEKAKVDPDFTDAFAAEMKRLLRPALNNLDNAAG